VRRRYPCASPHAHLERNHDASCVPLLPALKPDLLAPDARAPYPLCQLTSGCVSSTPWQRQIARDRRHCASRAPFGAQRQRWCADARQHARRSRLLRAVATVWHQGHASARLMGLPISLRPAALGSVRYSGPIRSVRGVRAPRSMSAIVVTRQTVSMVIRSACALTYACTSYCDELAGPLSPYYVIRLDHH